MNALKRSTKSVNSRWQDGVILLSVGIELWLTGLLTCCKKLNVRFFGWKGPDFRIPVFFNLVPLRSVQLLVSRSLRNWPSYSAFGHFVFDLVLFDGAGAWHRTSGSYKQTNACVFYNSFFQVGLWLSKGFSEIPGMEFHDWLLPISRVLLGLCDSNIIILPKNYQTQHQPINNEMDTGNKYIIN